MCLTSLPPYILHIAGLQIPDLGRLSNHCCGREVTGLVKLCILFIFVLLIVTLLNVKRAFKVRLWHEALRLNSTERMCLKHVCHCALCLVSQPTDTFTTNLRQIAWKNRHGFVYNIWTCCNFADKSVSALPNHQSQRSILRVKRSLTPTDLSSTRVRQIRPMEFGLISAWWLTSVTSAINNVTMKVRGVASGDTVKVIDDENSVRAMQNGHGGWNVQMKNVSLPARDKAVA